MRKGTVTIKFNFRRLHIQYYDNTWYIYYNDMLQTIIMVCDSYYAVAPNIRYTFSLSDLDGADFIQLKFKGINNCSFWLVSLQSVISIAGNFRGVQF